MAKNNHAICHLFAICLFSMLTMIMAAPAWATALDLANRPLFSGANIEPNILVAVDDSGSMDFETLFPTSDGLLYWSSGGYRSTGAFVDSNGQFINSSYVGYAYLFPNSANLYSAYYAVPPLPSFGFARDPEFNKAYFDPSVTYTPWLGKPQSTPTAANYAPMNASEGALDLTATQSLTNSQGEFEFQSGMVIPAGTPYYHQCSGGHGGGRRGGGGTCTSGFRADSSDYTAQSSGKIAVSYFPATFYLRQSTPLPSSFGWKASAPKITGTAPNGAPLYGYEIKPANFTTTQAYNSAIDNFANWFSYYRKRQLAVRGGIAAAFNQISRVRVGMCTINKRNTLNMLNLENATDRQTFYNQIFGLNFNQALGTPDSAGLQFLGQQLEKNSTIITSPCQQNFAILFTDGYNNEGPLKSVGNVDANSTSAATYGAPFPDSYSNTMADIAMKFYEDLGPIANSSIARNQMRLPAGCSAATPPASLDCEKDLHMVTFGVTLGQQGIIFNNPAYPSENSAPYNNPPNWSLLNLGGYGYGQEQIDDLWHATINSRGKLLNANTPQTIANAFSSALNKIIDFQGSATAFATNSGSLTAGSKLYQASFTAGSWQGDLDAYSLSSTLSTTTPEWDAAQALTAQDPSQRVILTDLASIAGASLTPAPFTFDALQSSAQNGLLNQAQVEYLRGVRTSETTGSDIMRNRGSDILGDIVHSDPAYVGAPDRYRYPDHWQDLLDSSDPMPENNGAPYSDPSVAGAFAQQYANRTPMVYVGANDGMLHGFSAANGAEKLAYVPNAVISNLPALTDPNYVHEYYVDGSPATGDVFFNGAWHTVLVGGLGDGGRSIYALDITDPSTFSQSDPGATVLWEYTASGRSDTHLGKTFGKPSIVRLHNGVWAAMFANGYNSTAEGASLYLVNIQTGALIKRIDTGAVPTSPSQDPGNGLSTPFPVDLDGDLITDYAYAGDLYGNMWRFDLTSANPANWTATKLFQAKDPSGNIQPITTRPEVGVHPYGRDYGVMVYFGTGKYLENSDAALNTNVQNSFYGIWDLDVFTFNRARNGLPLFTTSLKSDIPRDRLTEQSVTQTVSSNGQTYRVVSNNPVPYQQSADDTSGKRGWVLDLPSGNGELIVSNPRIQSKTVSFSTTIPGKQTCQSGGGGFFMILDASTGGRTSFAAFDLNQDYQFNAQDTVTVGNGTASVSGIAITGGAPGAATYAIDRGHNDDLVILPDSSAGTTQINVNVGRPPDGRRSWREIRR